MLKSLDFSEKSALRRALRARRAAVPLAERRRAAQSAVSHALRQRLLARGRRIGFYMPAKSEIDVLPLLERALRMGVDCYLPIVPGRGLRKLWFIRLGDHPAWFLNRYGIPEYQHATARTVRAYQLDMLFMPLLGFDAEGWRIGMGGGYYDASLAKLGRRRHWRRPRLVGVAFSVQQVDRVPNDPWDIPLSGVLTERGFLPAGRNQYR
jgi:5-formyltetrahydrofolate cyclo-ligase